MSNLNDLQTCLLSMLQWFDDFCKKNNLIYFACGGTLLGTIRHNGFIPWDDDIDLSMPRKDYERLLVLLSKPVDHYIVESIHSSDPNFLFMNAKLYDINTTMTEVQKKPIKRGVFIDIFAIDGIGYNRKQSLRRFKRVQLKEMFFFTMTLNKRQDRKWYKNVAIHILGNVPLNTKKLGKEIDSICRKYDYDKCEYVGTLTQMYEPWVIVDKISYGVPIRHKFESIEINVPVKSELLLKIQYHDWKKLPPTHLRIGGHEYTELNLNKSFLE